MISLSEFFLLLVKRFISALLEQDSSYRVCPVKKSTKQYFSADFMGLYQRMDA